VIRIVLLAALLPLCGCAAAALPWVAAAGGILTGTAALTNADVSAAKAYVAWRNGQAAPAAKP
jgi:hypothetical protein